MAALALRARRHGGSGALAGVLTDSGTATRSGWRRALLPADGVRALRSRPVLWMLVLALLPFVVTLESVNVVEVFLVRDVLGASPADYGLSEVVSGSAAIVGSFLAGSIVAERSRVAAILLTLFGCAAAQLGQGLAPSFPWYLVGAAVVGLLLAIGNACIFALVVNGVADDERGRAIAVLNGLSRACTTLALALGGVLATTLGPRAAYVTVGAAGLAVACVAALALARVHRSVDDPINRPLVSLPASEEQDRCHGEHGDQPAGPDQDLRGQTSG